MNEQIANILNTLDIHSENPGLCTGKNWPEAGGDFIVSYSPADGKPIASIKQATSRDFHYVLDMAADAFREWRKKPIRHIP